MDAVSDELIKSVVNKTIEVLHNQWSTKVEVVQFTQGTHRCYARDKIGNLNIVFGLPMMRGCMRHGHEYDKNVRNFEALVSIVVHEFSHVIQFDLGFIDGKDSYHDDIFWNIYKRALSQATPILKEKGIL